MFKFFVLAARLFLVFCVSPNFDNLARQRCKIVWGVSEVGKNDFSVYLCRLCVFFLVFYFSLLQSRRTLLHLLYADFSVHAHSNYVFRYGRMTPCPHRPETTAWENSLVHELSCMTQ